MLVLFPLPVSTHALASVPRVVLMGPPAVGKTTVQNEKSEWIAGLVMIRACWCLLQGWVLDGLPQTRLQARSLQQGGVIPKHVVLLDAGEDVLLERHRGRLLDPLTGGTPLTRRHRGGGERDAASWGLTADLQRYRCKVTGLSSAYRHILKTVDADQPPDDVYQQAVAFLRTRRCSRTPRVLLLGPPGSGKRLQAKMLADKYKMVDVCCSDLLSWAEADPSSVGEENVTLKVFQERLDRPDCSQRGWILHHLPCDLQHAKNLTDSLNAPNRLQVLTRTQTNKHTHTHGLLLLYVCWQGFLSGVD
uniref:Uncharacterized protein n=1 Tax=Hippocampus comes TaxID=109280 RepID=A0A3Q2YI47_HIPCM